MQLGQNQHRFSFAPHISLYNPTARSNRPLHLPAAQSAYLFINRGVIIYQIFIFSITCPPVAAFNIFYAYFDFF